MNRRVRQVLFATVVAGASACGSSSEVDPIDPLAPGTSSGSSSGGDGGGTSSSSGGDSGQPPPPPTFKKGEPFDYARAKPSQMVATMLKVFDYEKSTAPKAVAINAEGLGYVSVKAGATQADAERTAKEACFVIGGAKPCFLLAAGGSFAIDSTELDDPTKGFVLEKPPVALNDTLPFAVGPAVVTETDTYKSLTGFKAIAIGIDGIVTHAPKSTTSAAAVDVADAQRTALDQCEMQSAFVPCTIYASGTSVIYDPTKPNGVPGIDYARTKVSVNIPGSVMTAWNVISTDYLPKLNGGTQGAIFITKKGSGGYGTNTTLAAAQTTAKNQCASQQGSSLDQCFPYATNTTVLFKVGQIDAIAKYSIETHCKSMVRKDCAAHKAIGCTTSGDYYNSGSGTVKLERCDF